MEDINITRGYEPRGICHKTHDRERAYKQKSIHHNDNDNDNDDKMTMI